MSQPQQTQPDPATYEPFDLQPADVARLIPDDQECAAVGYILLWIRATEGDIDVYARPVRAADGQLRWNLWDNERQQRIPLEEWAAAWRAEWPAVYAAYQDAQQREQQRKGGAQ